MFNNPRNCTINSLQKGVFRSNCMDCLDRTNVVQGVFSRYVAYNQLEKLHLVDMPASGARRSPFEKFPEALETLFREGWTRNADALAYLYAGTPALKTDFTRTGKRSARGVINDGLNALTRYYINNFLDGHYHDCLDIVTLQLTPASAFLKPRPLVTPFKMSLLFMLVAVLFVRNLSLSVLLPTPSLDLGQVDRRDDLKYT